VPKKDPKNVSPGDPKYVKPGSEPLKNRKQELFCQHFLIRANMTYAAIKAGYSKDSARSQGSRLMTYVNIQDRISFLQDQQLKELKIEQKFVLQQLFLIANANLDDYVEFVTERVPMVPMGEPKEGQKQEFKEVTRMYLRDPKEIPRHIIGAVATFHETEDGRIKITLQPKIPALEKLGVYLGMWDKSGNKADDPLKDMPDEDEIRRQLESEEE